MVPSSEFASRHLHASSSPTGAQLTFETVVAGDGSASLRLRPEADTLLRVIGGLLRLQVEGDDRVLGAGDEAIVPAGALHRIESVYGAARFVTGFRPAY